MKTGIRLWMLTACGTMVLSSAFGQTTNIKARITGPGGPAGRCAGEVDVDSAVEIEIHGDEGRLRTVAGAPGLWRRLECTAPMPERPQGFRFQGKEGRGTQILLREPKDNRGSALIRIDDPQSGREGYNFVVEWTGAEFDGDRDRGHDDHDGKLSWNNQINFRGRGDGYYRTFRGQDDLLSNCEVSVGRRGEVRVTFDTNHGNRMVLTGQLTHSDRGHLLADVSGNGIGGEMEIVLDRDRVTDVNMSGRDGNRFELRWHR